MEGNDPTVRRVRMNARSPRTVDSRACAIVTGIVEELQEIVRGEVQLAKTELKEDASAAGKSAGLMGVGGYLALTGFFFLLLGVT